MSQAVVPSSNQPSTAAPQSAPARAPGRLFIHSKREKWGLAVLLSEREGKRTYQFEDGKRRTFKEGFYHLFLPRTPPAEPSPEVRALMSRAAASSEDELTLHQQLAYFQSQYPEGFQGILWQEEHRAREGKRALKRHRDPVISAAKAVLAKGELASLMMAGSHDEILGRVTDIMGQTDLVPSKAVKALAKAAPSAAFSRALMAYLHGPKEEEATAMTGWLTALKNLGIKPTWPLATSLRALVHPTRHAPIKTSVLKIQLEVLGKNVFPSKTPSAPAYAHACNALIELDSMLTDLGHEPADMLDVYDFIWCTLRPAARKDYVF